MYSAVVPHISFVALFTLLIALTSARCYYPNGTDVTTSGIAFTSYAPCNVSAEASMCCRINVTAGDHCRSDGLCDSPDYRYLWRESCTDPTWKSPHCQKLCLNYDGLDPWGGSVKENNVEVTKCDNGSFCCGVGTNGSTCCTEARGVWMVDGKETNANPNTTFSTAPSPSAASAPAAETSQPVAVSHHSNAGAIAGGVVGGVVALILLLGLLYWIVGRRHNGSTSKPRELHSELDTGQEKDVFTELPSVDRPHEADSQPMVEMDGGIRQEWEHRSSPRESPGPRFRE